MSKRYLIDDKTILENARKNHNLQLPDSDPNIQGLIAYCLMIGYNEGYREGKIFQYIKMKKKIQDIKKRIKQLIEKWTRQAQYAYNTDDESSVYYKCAEELFQVNK